MHTDRMTLIIYDSNYGNTKLIAESIAKTLGSNTKCVSVNDLQTTDLRYDLIIIGCPINVWRPTPGIATFLKSLAPSQLTGKKAAAFDTRVKSIFSGNAAKRIGKALADSGANLIVPPIGFYVEGNKGPLLENELERAVSWAKTIKSKL